jgi:hypothetical protein
MPEQQLRLRRCRPPRRRRHVGCLLLRSCFSGGLWERPPWAAWLSRYASLAQGSRERLSGGLRCGLSTVANRCALREAGAMPLVVIGVMAIMTAFMMEQNCPEPEEEPPRLTYGV